MFIVIVWPDRAQTTTYNNREEHVNYHNTTNTLVLFWMMTHIHAIHLLMYSCPPLIFGMYVNIHWCNGLFLKLPVGVFMGLAKLAWYNFLLLFFQICLRHPLTNRWLALWISILICLSDAFPYSKRAIIVNVEFR